MALRPGKTHNVTMESHQPTKSTEKPIFSRMAKTFAMLAVMVVVSACGEGPKKQSDPEIEHCLVALEKLTKDFTDVGIATARGWDVENIKNVSLTFDYTVPAQGTTVEAETLRGLMVCRYEYSIETRTTKGREAKAIAIRFRGRQLSLNELLLLNTSISGQKSRLQWPK